jgi:hypothetical protein
MCCIKREDVICLEGRKEEDLAGLFKDFAGEHFFNKKGNVIVYLIVVKLNNTIQINYNSLSLLTS